MDSNTVYLITGANRGIGLGLTSLLLSRPNTTVVGTVRHQSTDIKPLEALPKADGSVLIITHLSISTTSTSEIETAHKSLADQLKANHITKINVLIANAGVGSSFQTTATTPLSSVVTDFYANTLGPIALYQSLQPSLKAAENAKYIIIGSILGSIGAMAPGAPSLGYGVSKAGVHYVAKKIHHEEGSLVCVAVHPGWVQTENGQNFANSIGVPEPPMTVEQSAGAVLAQIDQATKDTTSGTFVGYDGATVLW